MKEFDRFVPTSEVLQITGIFTHHLMVRNDGMAFPEISAHQR